MERDHHSQIGLNFYTGQYTLQVQEGFVYDPYGKPTATPYLNMPYLFQGGRYDTTTGLYEFGARDYSPTLGRWMEQDPIGYAGGDSNLYGFVGENPATQNDPTGLDEHILRTIPLDILLAQDAPQPANTTTSPQGSVFTDILGGILSGTGLGLGYANGYQNQPTRTGQAHSEGPTQIAVTGGTEVSTLMLSTAESEISISTPKLVLSLRLTTVEYHPGFILSEVRMPLDGFLEERS